ncbi:MAG: hydantoinase/oxoprolinase N-terminal domain-containing protein [Thermodesulfobacteriota bacterium]|nr:hydantoinase/oxoprolinase N-terminal domain-containing protein [Thermodesulfobacteriota bacterium]
MTHYRLGVDVGGTFTDLVLIDSGERIFYTKVHSTPQDQTIGVLDGIKTIIEQYGDQPDLIDQIVHGTTAATNALLKRKGSKPPLLTTEGFNDFLYTGRQTKSELY